jgi:hypothetical protein
MLCQNWYPCQCNFVTHVVAVNLQALSISAMPPLKYFVVVPNSMYISDSLKICVAGLLKTKHRGLSPRANYTDRATAACRRI